ncbi:MAG: hypothetical protein QM784_27985 [Polyangiaceae bacterium]
MNAILGKAGLAEAGGATGLCAWIGEIEADSAAMNLPAVVLDVRLRVSVLENPVLNTGGLTSLACAAAIATAVHQWSPGENVVLLPAQPFLAPLQGLDEETGRPDRDVRGYVLKWRIAGIRPGARGPHARTLRASDR